MRRPPVRRIVLALGVCASLASATLVAADWLPAAPAFVDPDPLASAPLLTLEIAVLLAVSSACATV